MDAVKFLKAYNRMCNSIICDKCDLFDEDTLGCAMQRDRIKAEEIVAKVEKWVKENPIKTRQSEFLKMFPNAYVSENGALYISPCTIDEVNFNADECSKVGTKICNECRRDYWLQEVK